MNYLMLNPLATLRAIERDPSVFASVVLNRFVDPRWEIRKQCYARLRQVHAKVLSPLEKIITPFRPMPRIDV